MSDQKQNKTYESVSVTPVIRDLENLAAQFAKIFVTLFKWILDFLKWTIITIHGHWKMFLVVMATFFVLGYLSVVFVPREYKSDIILTTNSLSTDQLYSDIRYCDELVRNKEWNTLASILKIQPEEAKKITGFEIAPSGSDLDKVTSLSAIKKEIDTVSWSYVDIDKIMQDELAELHSKHGITILSTSPLIFAKLESPLLNYLERVDHLKQKKSTRTALLTEKKKFLENRIGDLDKLQKTYNEVLIINANKEQSNQVTNISLAEGKESQSESLIGIFDKYNEYQYELNRINEDLNVPEEYYEVVSKLKPVGKKVDFGSKGRALVMSLIGAGLLLLFFALKLMFKAVLDERTNG